MMRDNLIALPNDVLMKIFAIMDVRAAPRRAATLIQSIWRRTRALFGEVQERYRQDAVRYGRNSKPLARAGISARVANYQRRLDRYWDRRVGLRPLDEE
tara:strand:+ start:473 stop:769 length:297 start_codon:yes stop_codon:yes gene_type:complete